MPIRKLIARIIAFIIAALTPFLFITSAQPGPLASVPRLQQTYNATVPVDCATQVAYQERGFPFRVNLYDACKQNNTNNTAALILNWLTATAILYGLCECIIFILSLTRAKQNHT